MAKSIKLIITTDSKRSLRSIANDLKKAGLLNPHILNEIGSITGVAEKHIVAKLRKVNGVIDVSQETSINIGPPNSPETW